MTDAPLDTFPRLVARNAAQWPDAVALREKDFGIWREISWAGFHARVRDLALGLRALGIGPGAVVGLIGDNRPDWMAGEIAAHAAGAMSLGLYRDALDEEVAYLIDHAGIALVLAEDEEQVDKLLALGDRIPSLRHIVYTDPRGMRKYDDPRLLPVEAFIAGGAALEAAEPGLYDRMVAATRGDDVAVLCTTSGTTAHPKLAMLSAGSLIRHSASYLSVDPKGPQDEYVSVLPLSWIMEQVYVFGKALQCRMVVKCNLQPGTSHTQN